VGSAERCGQAVAVDGVGEVAVGVERADGAKCGRCWNYSTQARACSPLSVSLQGADRDRGQGYAPC